MSRFLLHTLDLSSPYLKLGDGGTACFSVRENAYTRFVLDIVGGEEKRHAARNRH